MAVLRMTHIGICVTDLERAVRFYRDGSASACAPSCSVQGEPSATLLQLRDVDLHAVYLERDGTRLELLYYAAPAAVGDGSPRPMNGRGLTHLSLRVDSVRDTLDTVRAAGAPSARRDAHRSARFRRRGGVHRRSGRHPDRAGAGARRSGAPARRVGATSPADGLANALRIDRAQEGFPAVPERIGPRSGAKLLQELAISQLNVRIRAVATRQPVGPVRHHPETRADELIHIVVAPRVDRHPWKVTGIGVAFRHERSETGLRLRQYTTVFVSVDIQGLVDSQQVGAGLVGRVENAVRDRPREHKSRKADDQAREQTCTHRPAMLPGCGPKHRPISDRQAVSVLFHHQDYRRDGRSQQQSPCRFVLGEQPYRDARKDEPTTARYGDTV